MPTIESRLEVEAQRWQETVDAAFDQVDWAQRPRRQRSRGYLAAASLLAAAAVVGGVLIATTGSGPATHHSPAPGDCAAPVLTVDVPGRAPTSRSAVPVSPGQTVTVTGRYYVNDCQESVRRPANTAPLSAVSLVLTAAGDRRTTVAAARPRGAQGFFTIEVRIPTDTPAGPATLTDSENRARSTIDLLVS
jgi:hypothetical protein